MSLMAMQAEFDLALGTVAHFTELKHHYRDAAGISTHNWPCSMHKEPT